MATSRITMDADDANAAIEVIAPVKKDFMSLWGVSTGPMFYWRRDGIPSPTAFAVAYFRDRVRAVGIARLVDVRAAVGEERFARGIGIVQERLRAGSPLSVSVGGDLDKASPKNMDGTAVNAAIHFLGYSKDGFAEWIGTTRRTVDRWIAGTAAVDKGIAWMLRVILADRGISLEQRDATVEAISNFVQDARLAGWGEAAIQEALANVPEPSQEETEAAAPALAM